MSKRLKKTKSKDAFDDLLDMADPFEVAYQLTTPVMDELKRRDALFCNLSSHKKPLPAMTWADRVFLSIADKHGLQLYGNNDQYEGPTNEDEVDEEEE